MSGLARQAAILSLARILNYGLMLVGPIILVRLLTVEDFGRYREFHLYAALLAEVAALTINDSLLYFLPSRPQQHWRVVRQTALLVVALSTVATTLFLLGDLAAQGRLAGEFALPVALYVLFFVNVDFWQTYWISKGQSLRVLAYTGGRSAARLLVAVGIAAATADVMAMVWGLVALELGRVLISAGAWAGSSRAALEPPLTGLIGKQLHYSVPMGLAVLLKHGSRFIGGLVVAKVLGPGALAMYAIGLYVEPVVSVVRSSISNIVLPEMVRRGEAGGDSLALWQRTTVLTCILLFPIAVVLTRFADSLVVAVFGADYLPAALLVQIYVVSVVRECFDFSPALRARGLTGPILQASGIGIIVNFAALGVLIPTAGTVGAMSAWVISSWCTGLYLAWRMLRVYGLRSGALLPWGTVLRVAASALLAAAVLIPAAWTDWLGVLGVLPASALYAVCFFGLLRLSRVSEERTVTNFIVSTLRPLLAGSRR